MIIWSNRLALKNYRQGTRQLRNAQSHPTQQLEFANLVFDTQSKQVKVDDQQVNLTAKEFQIFT